MAEYEDTYNAKDPIEELAYFLELIQTETAVIDLLEAMKQNEPIQQRLADAYFGLKVELGYRPTYLEFHLKATEDSRAIQQKFKTYPHADELDALKQEVLDRYKD
ncbi:hypothetical protein ABZ756_09965 [Mammaliicoccus sciuri]|uniref:hypothetical protein n=1 Tax=Sporosarcina TaxID=1569 RepID=UPI00099A6674|nr:MULTISPECIES: hypothetical protein [Sporosarcina]MBY0223859.1 hypothetical protein [Sporosarcina aquimarina]